MRARGRTVVLGRAGQPILPVSSWIFSATCLSLSEWAFAWWAQKSSSPPLSNFTRRYACAPQRSQRSEAVSDSSYRVVLTVPLFPQPGGSPGLLLSYPSCTSIVTADVSEERTHVASLFQFAYGQSC